MIRLPNPARLTGLLTVALAAALLAPSHARAQFPPDSLTNLEVLPQDIEVRALVDIMVGFTWALGVRCEFCHVGEAGMPRAQFKFPSDDKATKRKAREMLRMVETINDTYLASLEERSEPPIAVACATCHRGVRKPRTLVDILTLAYDEGGLEAVSQDYKDLRDRYYGRDSYDFGVMTLTEVASAALQRGSLHDAVEILAINLEHNPDAPSAQRLFASRSIELAYRSGGIEAGNLRFAELKERFGIPAFTQRDVNALGFRLLRSDMAPEAIDVFKLYVELYPESANAYDSLGEAYMTHGDTELAISSYQTSLELNPNNANAEEKLRELQSGG